MGGYTQSVSHLLTIPTHGHDHGAIFYPPKQPASRQCNSVAAFRATKRCFVASQRADLISRGMMKRIERILLTWAVAIAAWCAVHFGVADKYVVVDPRIKAVNAAVSRAAELRGPTAQPRPARPPRGVNAHTLPVVPTRRPPPPPPPLAAARLGCDRAGLLRAVLHRHGPLPFWRSRRRSGEPQQGAQRGAESGWQAHREALAPLHDAASAGFRVSRPRATSTPPRVPR